MPVSTDQRRSLDALEIATEQFHDYTGNPLAVIDEALATDPGFVMGHAFRAEMLATTMDKARLPEIETSLATAEKLAHHANDREWRHVAATRLWIQGDFAGAVDRWGEILFDHPRDSLALQLAHLGDLRLGQTTLLRDRIAQVLPYWTERVQGFGYLLAMHAFGLAENGDYSRAEETGRRAVALCPQNVWAIHAVAHVMEMQGRPDEGITWLTDRVEDWASDNRAASCNWWHLALYHLDLGQIQRALDIYDGGIVPELGYRPEALMNAAGLLWRLHLLGIDIGNRWDTIADALESKAEDGFYAFNDMCAMMAFIGAGRDKAAKTLLMTLQRQTGKNGTNGTMTREVGRPVCSAIKAFGDADYDAVIELLMSVRSTAHRFGGSHAQRDVLALTLIEAALRSGEGRIARALAAERTDLRPHNPSNWTMTARALDVMGDGEAAEMARTKATLQRVRPRLAFSA